MTLEGILEEMTISEVDSEGMTSVEVSEGVMTSLEVTMERMILEEILVGMTSEQGKTLVGMI